MKTNKNYFYVYSFVRFELSAIAQQILSFFIRLKLRSNIPSWNSIYISRSSLEDVFSTGLTKGLEELEKANLLIINHSYWNSEEESFTKSYNVTEKVYVELRARRYTREVSGQYKRRKYKVTKVVPYSYEHELCNLVKKQYKSISIVNDWQSQYGDPENVRDYGDYCLDIITVSKIERGTFAVKYGKNDDSRRLYHPIICGRRELRQFIRYKGKSLVDIDCKNCHPLLLAHFCSEEDKSKWLEFVGESFYERFVTEKYSRDEVKAYFQQAISKLNFQPKGIVQEIRNTIKSIAPSLYSFLEETWAGDETIQGTLQRLESEIFLEVVKRLIKGIFILPMHDGFIVERKNAILVASELDKRCLEVINYTLITSIKKL